jgi:hypothetical protein
MQIIQTASEDFKIVQMVSTDILILKYMRIFSQWLKILQAMPEELDNQIFVSKYMLQLPDEKTLLNFINKEKRHLLAMSETKRKKK